MAIPVLVPALIIAKLYMVFKTTGKVTAQRYRDETLRELASLKYFSPEYAESIVDNVEKRFGEREISADEYLQALIDVFGDIKNETVGIYGTCADSIVSVSKKARENIADCLQSAVDWLRSPAQEGKNEEAAATAKG